MKELKSNVALIGRVFLSRYSLFVLNGFLLSASLFFLMHDNSEHGLVTALASNIKKQYGQYKSEDSMLIGSLRLTHYLEERRISVFGSEEINDMYTELLRPVTYDLMTAKGACGSYSMVLGCILHELGFKVRFAQMKVDQTWGGHIIIEAQTKKGWVVLDPSYNVCFSKPDGNLASFKDVHDDWNHYKSQLPDNYKHEYAYADVRYTNWVKIPVVLPALKLILNNTIGKEATSQVCLRVFFLRKFRIMFDFALALYFYSWFRIVKRYRRKRRNSKSISASRMQTGKQPIYQRA